MWRLSEKKSLIKLPGSWNNGATNSLSFLPMLSKTQQEVLVSHFFLDFLIELHHTLHLPSWGHFKTFKAFQLIWIGSLEITTAIGVGISWTMQSPLQALSDNNSVSLVTRRLRMYIFFPFLHCFVLSLGNQLQWVRPVIGPAFLMLCWEELVPTYAQIHRQITP
jgi:hypothetical protein